MDQRASSRALREATRDPIVFVLGLAVLAGLVYAAVLALFTPPNDWDALTYHLARAAFWIQQHGIGYVPDSDVLRINVNPPNAEIGSALHDAAVERRQVRGLRAVLGSSGYRPRHLRPRRSTRPSPKRSAVWSVGVSQRSRRHAPELDRAQRPRRCLVPRRRYVLPRRCNARRADAWRPRAGPGPRNEVHRAHRTSAARARRPGRTATAALGRSRTGRTRRNLRRVVLARS